MSGYEGTHRDWLEDRASDQLEREDYEAEIARRQALPLWEFSHGEGWIGFRLQQFGQPIARFSMDHDIAVNFAHAILAEVEIAQRDEDADRRTEAGFMVCEFCHRGYVPEDGPHLCG